MKVDYETRNGYIETVKIEATYERSRQVPRIGTRRRMKVDGAAELVTLNEINVTRFADYNSSTKKVTYKFTAKEIWGTYFL